MSTERQKNPERIWLPDAGMKTEKMSVLAKSAPLGIIAVDLDGNIRFWNKAAEKITGWREDEALGWSLKVFSGKIDGRSTKRFADGHCGRKYLLLCWCLLSKKTARSCKSAIRRGLCLMRKTILLERWQFSTT